MNRLSRMSAARSGNEVRKEGRNRWAFAAGAVVLLLISGFAIIHLPGAGEHSISLSTVGSDVRGLSPGESTEFIINVKNTGSSRQEVSLSINGNHAGWDCGLYPDRLTIQPGKSALSVLRVSLPSASANSNTAGAQPFADYTITGRSGGNVSAVTVFTYINGTVEMQQNGTWKVAKGEVRNWQALRTVNSSLVQFGFHTENGDSGLVMGLLSDSLIELEDISGGNSTHPATDINLTLRNGSAVFYAPEGAQVRLTINTADAQAVFDSAPYLARLSTGPNGTGTTLSVYSGSGTFEGRTRAAEEVTSGASVSSTGAKEYFSYNLITVDGGVAQGVRPIVRQGNSIWGWDTAWKPINSDERGFSLISGNKALFVIPAGPCTTTIQGVYSGKYSFEGIQFSRTSGLNVEATYYRISNMTYNSITRDTIEMNGGLTLRVKEGTRRGYDFGIEYFSPQHIRTGLEIKGIPISNPEGHRFVPIDKKELSNPDKDSLRFELDSDGDGKFEKSVNVRHGMIWQEIEEKLNESKEEKTSILPLVISGIIIILVVVVVGFFTLKEKERQKKEKKAAKMAEKEKKEQEKAEERRSETMGETGAAEKEKEGPLAGTETAETEKREAEAAPEKEAETSAEKERPEEEKAEESQEESEGEAAETVEEEKEPAAGEEPEEKETGKAGERAEVTEEKESREEEVTASEETGEETGKEAAEEEVEAGEEESGKGLPPIIGVMASGLEEKEKEEMEEKPPTPEEEDDMEELPEDIFPLVAECPGCSTPMRISEPGEYRCSICHSLFYVDEEGRVKDVVEEEKKASFPLVAECPVCLTPLKISSCGRIRCPECGSILVADIEGNVREEEQG